MNQGALPFAKRVWHGRCGVRLRTPGLWGAATLALLACHVPAHANGTPAGTGVTNVATMDYRVGGTASGSIRSNPASFRVDEIVDLIISPVGGDVAVAPGDAARVVAFRLTNSGNGPESYRLLADTIIAGDAFDTVFTRIAFDTNGDGRYDPAVDVAYVPGVNDPLLDPDQSLLLFLISDVPSTIVEGDRAIETLAATALTGSGAPGTLFAGAGVGGSDAVIGTSRASSEAQGALVASLAAPSLAKSQVIRAPDGSAMAMPGALITYTLVASYAGALVASDARIIDPIPPGTTYVAGSITLNGAALSDAADSDAGEAGLASISVNLGGLAAGTSPSVTFQVRVND